MGLVAAKAGADYLGMVFVPGVRREVSIETSKDIVETLVNNLGDEKPMTVGLLDKYEPGVAGGTGKTFDWNIAKLASEQFEIILAGGLTPTNVAEAIRKVNPWCVDVSSGVESNGLKDSSKIIEFATSVKKSD